MMDQRTAKSVMFIHSNANSMRVNRNLTFDINILEYIRVFKKINTTLLAIH